MSDKQNKSIVLRCTTRLAGFCMIDLSSEAFSSVNMYIHNCTTGTPTLFAVYNPCGTGVIRSKSGNGVLFV